MKIFKIEFSESKPFTQKINNMIISSYYNNNDEGYWSIYSNIFLSEEEVLEVLKNDENLDKYLTNDGME